MLKFDDEDDNDLEQGEPCLFCNGEGITFAQGFDDEEEKDFVECEVCGGSGIDPESLNTFDDLEDEEADE